MSSNALQNITEHKLWGKVSITVFCRRKEYRHDPVAYE